MQGLHVMMFLDLIGRVAGNGNNKVMDLDPPPKWGIILSLRWVILRERKRSDAMGKMVVVVVVVVELIFLNNNYCWPP